ncbi:MAG: hypothetical protein HN494_13595, partial [Opitutae bacterium]|nr:hypothetical protein [Opitutae bacterium]
MHLYLHSLKVSLAALYILWTSSSMLSSEPAKSWKLVWADEFEGPTLDYSKWGIEVNAFGGGNNEMQIYTDR